MFRLLPPLFLGQTASLLQFRIHLFLPFQPALSLGLFLIPLILHLCTPPSVTRCLSILHDESVASLLLYSSSFLVCCPTFLFKSSFVILFLGGRVEYKGGRKSCREGKLEDASEVWHDAKI